MELLVVVVLMGIFAATAGMRFGRTLFAEFGAQSVARELSLALLTCQRAAITSGEDHYLEFLYAGGKIVQYQIMRDTGGSPLRVDGPKTLSSDVTVTSSHSTLHYDFEGSALASYGIVMTGQDRVWRIDVVPVTGALTVTQSN